MIEAQNLLKHQIELMKRPLPEDTDVIVSPGASLGPYVSKQGSEARKAWRCRWCFCSGHHTPALRRGPLGSKTLCNACGMSYNRNGFLPRERYRYHLVEGVGSRVVTRATLVPEAGSGDDRHMMDVGGSNNPEVTTATERGRTGPVLPIPINGKSISQRAPSTHGQPSSLGSSSLGMASLVLSPTTMISPSPSSDKPCSPAPITGDILLSPTALIPPSPLSTTPLSTTTTMDVTSRPVSSPIAIKSTPPTAVRTLSDASASASMSEDIILPTALSSNLSAIPNSWGLGSIPTNSWSGFESPLSPMFTTEQFNFSPTSSPPIFSPMPPELSFPLQSLPADESHNNMMVFGEPEMEDAASLIFESSLGTPH
ncbi:Chromatin structure remodeling complex protein sfh1 [Quaeritorhiza haematococci]|nr:Chromatin structure remodeling complex protein sfh1 [Quaeritorhiza haematococci]